jgi:hypothetical protein
MFENKIMQVPVLGPGYVVERVGSSPVHTPDQVADAIHTADNERKGAISVLVLRDGNTFYLGLPLT